MTSHRILLLEEYLQNYKKRFNNDTISKLLEIKWWDWPYKKIQSNIKHIQSGNIDKLV